MSDLGNKRIMADNILHYMNINGKTRNDLCRDLEFKYTTVTGWLTGEKYPRIDKIELMANYFGVSKSDLVEKRDTLPRGAYPYHPTHRIPILGRISAGQPLYAEENIEGYIYTELNGDHEYYALRIMGDSMNAMNLFEGDIVIVRRQECVDNGQVAVVLIDGEDATVKRFMQSGDTVTLIPSSTNPEHMPQIYDKRETAIVVQGLVVQLSRDIK